MTKSGRVTFSDPIDPVHQKKREHDHGLQQYLEESADAAGATTSSSNMFRHISKLDDIVAAGNIEKAFLLKEKKVKFNFITTKILKEQQQQKLAAMHYSAVHERVLFVPSILLTLMSAVLAILVKSSLIPGDNTQTWIAFTIAIISIMSTFVQSLMKQLDLSGRASSHEAASTNLKKLYEFLILSKKEQRYNSIYKSLKTGRRLSENNNLEKFDDFVKNGDKGEGDEEKNHSTKHSAGKEKEKTPNDSDESEANHLGSICSQFRLVTESCTSPVPVNISTAFDMIEARINLVNTSMMVSKKQSKIDFSKVFPTIYYQLTMTLIQSRIFPTRIPSPEWIVKKTFKDWRAQLVSEEDTSAQILDSLYARDDVINNYGENRPLLSSSYDYHDDQYA